VLEGAAKVRRQQRADQPERHQHEPGRPIEQRNRPEPPAAEHDEPTDEAEHQDIDGRGLAEDHGARRHRDPEQDGEQPCARN
jgi:hypothetical protein